jgi:hypothetical protein
MQRILAAASLAAGVLAAGAAQAKPVKVQDCLAFAAGYGYFNSCEGHSFAAAPTEQRIRVQPPRPPRGHNVPLATIDPRESGRDGGGGGSGGGGGGGGGGNR